MDSSIDITNETFRADIITGLKKAYVAALTKANLIFYQKTNNKQVQSFENIKIVVDNIVLTGRTNPENTKNVVNLKYYILDQNNVVLSPVFAADCINLLTKSDMGIYLKQEVEDQGRSEEMPRNYTASEDQKLWIIGAVLGPLALLIFLFWLIAFTYYKCIRPKNTKDNKAGAKRLKNESPSSVCDEFNSLNSMCSHFF